MKPKQILEILLLARGKPVPKDRLADLLWEDRLPKNVSATLETYVSVVRRRLGRLGPDAERLIVTEPGAYRFDGFRCALDLDRFDTLVHEAAVARPGQARAQLEAAIALVGGELLADEPYAAWVQEQRESYRQRYEDALLWAAGEALAERDLPAALDHSSRATDVAPLSERAWRTVMLALYSLSRRSSALQAFERCQSLLAEELGVDPASETLSLREAILRQEGVERLLPPPVAPPAMSAPFARSGGQVDLPLYGRSRELAQLVGLVEEAIAGAFTFVLVEGEAGIGKTRLLEAALVAIRGGHETVRVGAARGNVLERRLPGVLLADALRLALTDVAELEQVFQAAADPRGGRGWLGLEHLARVVNAAAPIVVVLDDIHHADPTSLSALAFLRRRCRSAPVAVLGAYRPEEAYGNHPLHRVEVDARLRLDVLSAAELPDLCPAALAKTGGHPQLLAGYRATAGSDAMGWAPFLVETVLRRAQESGVGPQRILLTASIFCRPFGAEELAGLLAVSPLGLVEELDSLCERRLLRTEGGRFVFRYEAVREILAESMSSARRALLTRRLESESEPGRGEGRLRAVAGS